MTLLQIGEHCSAACSHCPFTTNNRWKSVFEIIKEAENMAGPFVTLTGGEPLEHPQFLEIIETLHLLGIPFRVATGGHIPLSEFSRILDPYPEFLGFNLGTDIMSNRNNNSQLKTIWQSNKNFLKHSKIPWSLTLTLGQGLDPMNLIRELNQEGALPSFLMLNTLKPDARLISEFKRQLSDYDRWSELLCQ